MAGDLPPFIKTGDQLKKKDIEEKARTRLAFHADETLKYHFHNIPVSSWSLDETRNCILWTSHRMVLIEHKKVTQAISLRDPDNPITRVFLSDRGTLRFVPFCFIYIYLH